MPNYDAPVIGAKRAALALAGDIQDDLDDGGIAWWVDYPLSTQTRALLSHYTVSVVRGVEANLDEASFHCFQYQDRVRTEDNFLTSRFRQAKGQIPDLRSRQEIDRRRQTEISAQQGAFFRSIGSVLDTLAGVAIAVGALQLDLLRADFGMLRTSDTSDAYPRLNGEAGRLLRKALADKDTSEAIIQEALLRSVRAAVDAAGPPGWAQWTLDTRNNFVHRPRWLNLVMHHQPSRTSPITWFRPLPRIPADGEGSALRTADSLADTHLTEDALDSMQGVLESVDALTKAVIEQCAHLWRRRRANPRLLTQPDTQWKERSVITTFGGYNPGSAQRAFDAADAVIVNPSDGARLSALMDKQKSRKHHRTKE